MYSYLNVLALMSTGNFERRGRKVCAKNAEEVKERMHSKNAFQSPSDFLKLKMASGHSITQYFFGILFYASSAQLMRPLRSKIPLYTLTALLTLPSLTQAQNKFDGVGRQATANEVKAWDIDVRPDFKGLPKGQGSVAQGEKLWEAQCASCHGSFAESNEVFPPLAGYTTKKDIETGKVASLQLSANAPTRTTLMKVSQLSTLWDYINRAMPWTAPKSLKPDEVYAVTAYLLNLGEVVPADFTLSDSNMAQVQQRLPNRLGATTVHAMWPGKELGGVAKPDVQGSACTNNCATAANVASFIPEYARDAHGNLAEQSRRLGGLRGAETMKKAAASKPVTAATASNSGNSAAQTASLTSADVMPTLQKYACVACHGMDNKLVGPSFKDIVAKQGARADAQAYLSGKIKAGGQGVYGQIPMPAQSLSLDDAQAVARWLVQGAKQ
jgi:S-disulfanyl-L-cysteine oxidoreductase SoxD